MSASLRQRVESVQRSAMRLVWRYGAARFAAAAIGLLLAAATLDYLLRLHDPALRWLLSGAVLGGCGWLFIRLARPVFRFRPNLVSAARRIEQRYPALSERLSSAMAFLLQAKDDPTAGSADLRRAVVAEAEALAAGLDFQAALDRRGPRQMTLVAATVLAIACLLAAFNPAAAGLAVRRLAQPWRELPWPRRHELAFVQAPRHLASGSNLELAVVDRRGKLPETVELLVRQGTLVEVKEMKPLGDRMVARLDNVTRDLAYRARGGDDDLMPWVELVIVEPPKVTELIIELQPPAYSGLPARSEGRVLRALVGSKLRVRGQLDKPIRSAIGRSEVAGLGMPAVAVAAGGRRFSAPASGEWLVERSGAFWFELTDDHGVTFGRDTRIELTAAVDAPPSIAWESPADHSFVTPRAIVPVRGSVKDDLAIRGIQLRYLRPGQSDEEQIVELYAARDSGRPAQTATTGRGFEGQTRSIDHSWDLAQLAGLAPGDVLAVRITAEDYKPQLATSAVHRLTIITDEELTSRITQRQGAILSQLAEALRMARVCREQVAALEARLLETKQLTAADLNHLQSAQHNQRQVERLLGASPEGAEGQLVALLAELAANRVENHASGQRLNELLTQVRALSQQPLPAIDRQLSEAFKSARDALDAVPCAEEPAEAIALMLHSAGGTQEEVVQALERMVGTLAEWDSFSRLSREIGQIRTEEERLARETDELLVKAAAAEPADRNAGPPAAAAQNLSRQQLELARQLDKLQTRMEQMLTRLQTSDPLAAGTLADALNTARSQAIGGQMREAATRLRQLQLGQARQTEQLVLDGLKQLLETLSLRRDYELARTIGSLRDASAALGGMLSRSTALQAELAAAAAQPNDENRRRQLQRLQRELEKLAQESQELGRRLQRLQAARPAAALGQAASSSAGAAQAAGGGDAEAAQQQGADAHRRLEEAQQELAQAITEAEQELLQEQLARVEQLVAGIAARQKNVVAEVDRLHAKEPTPAELRNLAAEEQLLADETSQLRPKLDAAEAFGFALDGASQQMRRAGGLLQRGDSGPATKLAANSALTRLNQILEALRPDEPMTGGEANPGQQPPAGSPSGNPSGATAELKLLHLLQQEINRRTVELERSRQANGTLTADEQTERDALAREQGRLADMVLNLIEAAAQRPEDDLDLIPELPPKEKQPQP